MATLTLKIKDDDGNNITIPVGNLDLGKPLDKAIISAIADKGIGIKKDNLLIRKAQTDLTRNEQKLMNFLLTVVEPTDEDFQPYGLSISNFADLFNFESNHPYRDFKNMMEGLDKKTISIEDDEVATKIHWVIMPRFLKKEGYIEVRLDPRMKKYLIDLKDSFTDDELFNILSLKTKYATAIYELLKSYQRKTKTTIDMELDKFKEFISTDLSTYKNFGNFKQRILEPALNDINMNTDLTVSYKCLDAFKKDMSDSFQGRKVYYLRFTLSPNKAANVTWAINKQSFIDK